MVNFKEAIILIVEDNADNMFLAIHMLRGLGVRYVNGRASGRMLFRLLENSPEIVPDLILMDIQIPHEDGYTILKQIRDHRLLSKTCVVALTANIMEEDLERARKSGFDGFVGKPLNFKRFPDQMKRILAGEQVWEPT